MRNILFKIIIIALLVFNIPSFLGAWGGFFIFDGSLLHAQWKAYLSYDEPTEIERAGDGTLYVLASGDLYSYNPTDQQIITYDKTTVLNDCGIAHIAWCQAARRLVIAYNDYNIDLLSPNGNVVNLPAYMNTSMTDEKTVNSLDVSGRNAYLSTNFGIVQINVADASFTNTYRLGFRVDYCYTDGNYIYAASSTNGTYRGLMTSNLLDPSQWTRTAGYAERPKTMDPTLLSTVKTLNPGGPKYNYFGFLKFYNNKLYSVGGGYKAISEFDRPASIQILNGDDWTILGQDAAEKTDHYFADLTSLDIDPKNENHLFVSGRTGLYEFLNNSFVAEYTPENSPLRGAQSVRPTSKDYNLVLGIKYDNDGNLWMLNSISATTSILELTSDGQWVSHHKTELVKDGVSLQRMECPYIDSRGLLWAVNDFHNYPEAFCYQPSTEGFKQFDHFVNEDGTQVDVIYVRCITEDKEGNMWIGTDKGPIVLESNQITADNPIFTQVKVPRNDGTDYADYLLSGVDISYIYVDRANRKWIGTNGNGLYLISANNIVQLQHFTKENSKLLSNNIESITINENTGEVFIGTDVGLCSYTSAIPTPSEGMTKDNVYAYPNPVRPDYRGAITITGLDENADVKIMTSSGALVNEGKATGGQYQWYGLDKNGKQVASGVYMVAVATADGDKGVVCKIAIVR